jgi:hypothetical protein
MEPFMEGAFAFARPNEGRLHPWPGAKAFAGDVRDAWERAVEEELFRGVVMRFQRDVKAQHIRDVEVTAALTQEVYDGMTETSPYHHEPAVSKTQAPAAAGPAE